MRTHSLSLLLIVLSLGLLACSVRDGAQGDAGADAPGNVWKDATAFLSGERPGLPERDLRRAALPSAHRGAASRSASRDSHAALCSAAASGAAVKAQCHWGLQSLETNGNGILATAFLERLGRNGRVA